MDEQHESCDRRRSFCKACIGGAAVLTVGTVTYPVISFLGRPATLASNKPLEIPLEKLSVGQAQYAEFQGRQIIVLITPEGPHVFSASCSHLGCNVTWDTGEAVFRCPCHGAVFNGTGQAVSGPVSAPLEKIPFEVKEGKIVIS